MDVFGASKYTKFATDPPTSQVSRLAIRLLQTGYIFALAHFFDKIFSPILSLPVRVVLVA
jgi:hypothetical protein